MTIPSLPTVLLCFSCVFSVACEDWLKDNGPAEPQADGDMAKPVVKDLANADLAMVPRCLAARVITGDILKETMSGKDFCIDFDSGQVTDSMLSGRDWNLSAQTVGCQGFTMAQVQIDGQAKGRLTINQSKMTGNPKCQARLPALTIPPNAKNIVVSIVHSLTLESDTQSGKVELASISQQSSGWSGKNVVAPRTTTLEFTPDGQSFQAILTAQNLNSMPTSVLPVWQIQSIAVLSTP